MNPFARLVLPAFLSLMATAAIAQPEALPELVVTDSGTGSENVSPATAAEPAADALTIPALPKRSLPAPPAAKADAPADSAPRHSMAAPAKSVPTGPMTLEEFAAEVDSWMPIAITATEHLTSARAEPAGLVLAASISGTDANAFDAAVARIAHQSLTCDLLLTRMVLDAGITVSYRLSKEDGTILDTIAFTPADCARD